MAVTVVPAGMFVPVTVDPTMRVAAWAGESTSVPAPKAIVAPPKVRAWFPSAPNARFVAVVMGAVVGLLRVTTPVVLLMAMIVVPAGIPGPETSSFTYRVGVWVLALSEIVEELAGMAAAG